MSSVMPPATPPIAAPAQALPPEMDAMSAPPAASIAAPFKFPPYGGGVMSVYPTMPVTATMIILDPSHFSFMTFRCSTCASEVRARPITLSSVDPTATTPVGPTPTPVGPAATPVGPAAAPVVPTAASVGPAATPVGPAATPVGPAAAPVVPAAAPVVPTAAPVVPARLSLLRNSHRSAQHHTADHCLRPLAQTTQKLAPLLCNRFFKGVVLLFVVLVSHVDFSLIRTLGVDAVVSVGFTFLPAVHHHSGGGKSLLVRLEKQRASKRQPLLSLI
jgi:hypothetical protein